MSAALGRALALCIVTLCAPGCASQAVSLPRSATWDAIVVLGHRPARDEHGLEAETLARTSRGIALYREKRAPRLVFTGGHTSPGASEAEVMAAHAQASGVPAQALRLESASRDTIENARFTVALLSAELARAPRVLLVTSDYHVKRATALFECAGAKVVAQGVPLDGLGALSRFGRRAREVAVRVMYWFIDECERVRAARAP